MRVVRNAAGDLLEVHEAGDAPSDLPAESVMHLEVDEQGSAEVRERIAATLAHVLREVRETVADSRPLCDQVNDLLQVLQSNPPPVPTDEQCESSALLPWMVAAPFQLTRPP